MFFLPSLIILSQLLTNFKLPFLENAPVMIQVMAFFIAWVVSWLPIAAIVAIFVHWQPTQPLQPEQKLPLLVSLYLIAPLLIWGASWITHRDFFDYGFSGKLSMLSSLGLGFVLGVLSVVVVYAAQFWLGWVTFAWSDNVGKQLIAALQPLILPILLVALLVGAAEELVFRGFLLTELEQDYPVWLAAVISSVIFALLHLVWEQNETTPQLPGLWLMGMVLVLARLVNGGSLGLAWGLHTGWIWAIACMDTAQILHYPGKVPEWVTGQNKKPLAGVVGTICLLMTGGVIWLLSDQIIRSS